FRSVRRQRQGAVLPIGSENVLGHSSRLFLCCAGAAQFLGGSAHCPAPPLNRLNVGLWSRIGRFSDHNPTLEGFTQRRAHPAGGKGVESDVGLVLAAMVQQLPTRAEVAGVTKQATRADIARRSNGPPVQD